VLSSFSSTVLAAETVYATKPRDGSRVTYTNEPTTPLSFEVVAMVSAKRTATPSNVSAQPPDAFVSSAVRIGRTPMLGYTTVGKFSAAIDHASLVYGVDPRLISAVIKAESAFNPQAVSPKGARGLMQLMPDTARRYGVLDVHDPQQNILGGTAYLRDLIKQFDNRLDLVLAAYNAGENAVIRFKNTIPPFHETQNYVREVLSEYKARVARLD
jgi:soluble lytic murein transglycosylase-like protein